MSVRWVPKTAVLVIHEALVVEHGGAAGLRDEGLLDSALVAPENLLAYGEDPDPFDLAAKYASSIIRDHPFRDGNKRVGFTVAGVFLEMNGYRLEADEVDAVAAVLALTTRDLDEKDFATWLRQNSVRASRRRR